MEIGGATSAANDRSVLGGSPAGLLADGADRDMFFRLLVTQIQNQDPLNPQDPTAFVSQLAQFSSLEQLLEMGNSNSKQLKSCWGNNPSSRRGRSSKQASRPRTPKRVHHSQPS